MIGVLALLACSLACVACLLACVFACLLAYFVCLDCLLGLLASFECLLCFVFVIPSANSAIPVRKLEHNSGRNTSQGRKSGPSTKDRSRGEKKDVTYKKQL